jgi:SAM-dependent methyltransferase
VADPAGELKHTFDRVADLYETARPEYPAALFDDLVELSGLAQGAQLLEIGCATGKATKRLLARGFRIVCVELGAALAAGARENLAGLPAEIHVAAFEEWEGEPGAFDLVYAATAWRWLDPAVRYRKAHELLRPGGHLAFWNATHAFPGGFDPFFTDIQAVYDELGESYEGAWPPPPPEEEPDDCAEIEGSGLFERARTRRYLWEQTYSAEEYIALLRTFSGHIAMGEQKERRLHEAVRELVDGREQPVVRRHWHATLHVARRVTGRDG